MASWRGVPAEDTQKRGLLQDSGFQVFCPPNRARTPEGGSPQHPSPFLGQHRAASIILASLTQLAQVWAQRAAPGDRPPWLCTTALCWTGQGVRRLGRGWQCPHSASQRAPEPAQHRAAAR